CRKKFERLGSSLKTCGQSGRKADHCKLKYSPGHFIGHVAADNTIWNVSKDRPFLTVCFCCPCCCTQFDYYRYLPPEAKDTIHRLQGIALNVDENKCVGCGKCTMVCLTGAATLCKGKSHIDEKVCKTCGVCAQTCPEKAITVRVENVENTINALLGRIDQEVGGLPVKSYFSH
ncbi:MAG: hypothetical protein CVU52_10185, partial [Deltaproteobacteria bacterium HGW-Deltaproteobacteria-10]